jgi:hypothetical protein
MTCHDDPSEADELGEGVTSSPQGLAKSGELPGAAPASANGGAAPESLEAMDVLQQAISNLLDRHKQPRAAGVKSEMQQIISGKFDQSAYGYGTFRDFLDDAAAKGAVVIVDSPTKGGDALVTLPGRDVPIPATTTRRRRRGRIRPDIWQAFVSWEPGYTRLWDLETGHVLMFPAEPRPLEPQDHRVWRELARTEPDRFRAIPVIGEDRLSGRMRSFIQALDPADEAVPILDAALEQAKPARSFTAAARALPGIAERWKQERLDFIWDSITEWQESNGIQSSIEEIPGRNEDRQSTQRTNLAIVKTGHLSQRPADGRRDSTADATRERIFAALARMPTSELLRLRVPVEYLIDL